jgi:hypothetical protein
VTKQKTWGLNVTYRNHILNANATQRALEGGSSKSRQVQMIMVVCVKVVSNQACTFLSLWSTSMAESDQGIMEYGIVVLSFCWFTSGVLIVVAGLEVTYSAIGRVKVV